MTWGNFHYLCCVLQHLFSKETQSGVVMCKVPICILSITFFLVLQSMVSLHQILMPSIPTKGKRLAIKTSFSTILALMVALLKILICIISIRAGRLSIKTFFPIILALLVALSRILVHILTKNTSRSKIKTSRQTLYNVQNIQTNHLLCIHMK